MSIARLIALVLVLAVGMTLPAFAQRPQAAQTVTKTWTLTLDGTIPSGESFGVEYRDPAGREVAPLVFCGPNAEAACRGDGTTYTQLLAVPHGFELYFRIFRGQPFSPQFEMIQDGWETMTADSTTVAQYRVPVDPDPGAMPLTPHVFMPLIAP